MIYVIRLKNCAFYARHGAFLEEQTLGQRFYVDADLTVEAADALESDSLEGTVDYGKAFLLVEKIVTGAHRSLIEKLAMDIAKALAAEFPQIIRAEITVRKPGAPIPGVLDDVEVTLVWPQ